MTPSPIPFATPTGVSLERSISSPLVDSKPIGLDLAERQAELQDFSVIPVTASWSSKRGSSRTSWMSQQRRPYSARDPVTTQMRRRALVMRPAPEALAGAVQTSLDDLLEVSALEHVEENPPRVAFTILTPARSAISKEDFVSLPERQRIVA